MYICCIYYVKFLEQLKTVKLNVSTHFILMPFHGRQCSHSSTKCFTSSYVTNENLAHYLLVFCCSAELCDSHKIVKHKWLVTGRLIGYSYKGIQSCFSILYSSVQRDIDFCFLKSGALHQEDAHSKFCLLILEHHFSWHQMPWSTFLILNVVVPSVRLISKVMKALVLLACP